jgi:hypothetical protein
MWFYLFVLYFCGIWEYGLTSTDCLLRTWQLPFLCHKQHENCRVSEAFAAFQGLCAPWSGRTGYRGGGTM